MLNADDVPHLASRYLAGADPRHPYASPLYGDPAGLPPTLIQVGGDEILLDDSVRMAARLREAGVTVAARNLAAHAARFPVVFVDPPGSPPRDPPYRRLCPDARRRARLGPANRAGGRRAAAICGVSHQHAVARQLGDLGVGKAARAQHRLAMLVEARRRPRVPPGVRDSLIGVPRPR